MPIQQDLFKLIFFNEGIIYLVDYTLCLVNILGCFISTVWDHRRLISPTYSLHASNYFTWNCL